jgi:hypothetical protein
VRKPVGRIWRSAVLVLFGLLLIVSLSYALQDQEPGHSIGKVSTRGDLIVMELDDRALGTANLFDLTGHTLRFTPEGSRYRVESGPLVWDSDYGPELTGAEANLHPPLLMHTLSGVAPFSQLSQVANHFSHLIFPLFVQSYPFLWKTADLHTSTPQFSQLRVPNVMMLEIINIPSAEIPGQ